MFDINCKKSFISVMNWKKQLDDLVLLPNGNPIPCLLIANKCDVEPESIKSLPSLGQFCKENKFCGYYLTSAKENINVNEALHFLVEQVCLLDSIYKLIKINKNTNAFHYLQIVSNKEITENLLKKKTMSKEIQFEKKSVISRCC